MKYLLKFKNIILGQTDLRQRFFKNFSIGIAGEGLSIVLGLCITVLLTKSMTIGDYGRILMVFSLFRFLQALLGIRVQDVIFRFYPQKKEESDIEGLRGLVLLCLVVSIGAGLLLAGCCIALSNWFAEYFYHEAQLGPLFRIYAGAVLLLSFEGFYKAILRIYDRVSVIVVPQVIGNGVILLILVWYFGYGNEYSLNFVMSTFLIGTVIQAGIPLFISLKLVKRYLSLNEISKPLQCLAKDRSKLISTFLQTNIVKYLKLAGNEGGLFLLAIIAGPYEVALYGIASQLSKSLLILQNNIQNALTPEIILLNANQELKRLYNLVRKYVMAAILLGGIAFGSIVILGEPILLLVSKPDYLEALPVLYLLVFTGYLTFGSLVFFPLALVFDELKRRNLIVSLRFIYLGIAVIVGLNAFGLSMVQALGALTTRLLNDLPLYNMLKKRSRRKSARFPE